MPNWSGHSYDVFVRYAHADNGKPPSPTGRHLTVQENRTNWMLRSGVKSSTGTSSLILFYPTPLIVVHMSGAQEKPTPNMDVVLPGLTDFDAAAARILEELERRGVLAQAIGAKPIFRYSI